MRAWRPGRRSRARTPCSAMRHSPNDVFRFERRSVACTLGNAARATGPPRMHILMIAPEPFFEPRGTPFSEFHRIRALTALGHQVDLVTYPFGRDVSMPGLRLFRAMRPPFIHGVKIGPSI